MLSLCSDRLQYDSNGFLVGYDRKASTDLDEKASLTVNDGIVSGFSCKVDFFAENGIAENVGIVVMSRHENNLNIDLYPIFVYLGETFWTDLSTDVTESQDWVETYEYVMSGDYIAKVVYDDGDMSVTYEFLYE